MCVMNSMMHLAISTPGRICLFGEHQDYLYLPVIPAAISLRIRIEGRRRSDSLVRLSLPDINSEESFRLDENLQYNKKRDYFKSVVNVLHRRGFEFLCGFDCEVRSRIPIQAGTSSSSALNVGWTHFLTRMSEHAVTLTPEVIARYAHEAEVIEFNEPGGMMDHLSTAFG